MGNRVGILAAVLAMCIVLPGLVFAGELHPKKYGLEFQFGGGYYLMNDVNDWRPSRLKDYKPDKTTFGGQMGLGIIYRYTENFGWNIGYNRLFSVPKYRIEAYLSSEKSWAEQSVVGSELFALATWYTPQGEGELMVAVGPAIYSATLDRTVDIVQDPGSHLTTGTFSDASGKSLGMLALVGFEMPMSEDIWWSIQVGGRLGKVGTLEYTDPSDPSGTEQTVMFGAAKMTVDFTGAFARLSVRTYFKPAYGWRQPRR